MLVERSAFLFPRCNCSLSELGTYVRTTDGTVHVGKKNEKRMLLRRLARRRPRKKRTRDQTAEGRRRTDQDRQHDQLFDTAYPRPSPGPDAQIRPTYDTSCVCTGCTLAQVRMTSSQQTGNKTTTRKKFSCSSEKNKIKDERHLYGIYVVCALLLKTQSPVLGAIQIVHNVYVDCPRNGTDYF